MTLPPDHREDDAPPERERAMSLPGALIWTAGITFLFLWLLALILKLRPAAESDLITGFGCQLVAYLLGLFAILRVHAPHAEIRDFVGLRATHPAFYPLAVVIGLAIMAPISALYDAIDKRWPNPDGGDGELVRMLVEAGVAKQVAICMILIVLGPVIEEVLFRGALTRPLRRRHGAPVVILATALLFGVAHFQWQKMLPIALFGILLGVIRTVSGSLIPSIVLHATYNAIPVALILVAPEDVRAAADAPLPAWLLIVSVVAAAVLLAVMSLLGARSQTVAIAREKENA